MATNNDTIKNPIRAVRVPPHPLDFTIDRSEQERVAVGRFVSLDTGGGNGTAGTIGRVTDLGDRILIQLGGAYRFRDAA